ncbi:MAG: hypothetical protein L0170_16760 [Acidobacteria bacterium]|nr:hypothetical protein [Acidobacteriota bacterium]
MAVKLEEILGRLIAGGAASKRGTAEFQPAQPAQLAPTVQGDPITAALQAGAGMNPTAGRMRVQQRLNLLIRGFV